MVYSYYFLNIMSSRWRPLKLKHVRALLTVSSITFRSDSADIREVSWVILVSSYLIFVGFVVYTLDLMKPQRKKSAGDRSGDFGGQGTSPNLEVKRPGKCSLNNATVSLAVCDVAPSCWNQKSWTSPCLSISGIMKFLIMDRYFSPVTVDVVPSSFYKKYGPNWNPALISHQVVTQGECSGLSWTWCRFSWFQILELCMLTHLDRWKLASSEKIIFSVNESISHRSRNDFAHARRFSPSVGQSSWHNWIL